MKKLILILLAGFLLSPILSKAQDTTANVTVHINSMCDSVPIAIGCSVWVEDVNGDTIVSGQLDSTGFKVFDDFTYYSSLSPYKIRVDENCLNANDIYLYSYTLFTLQGLTGGGVGIIESICPPNTVSVPIYSGCNDSMNDGYPGYLSYAAGCNAWIEDQYGTVVAQYELTGYSGYGSGPSFHYQEPNAPYFLKFDENCLNSSGVFLNEYSFEVNDGNMHENFGYGVDSIFVCASYDSSEVTTINFSVGIYSFCNNQSNDNLGQAAGCDTWVKDANGNIVAQYTLTPSSGNGDGPNFQYNMALAPYTFELDQNCLNGNGVFLPEYAYVISNDYVFNGYGYDSIYLCSENDSIEIPCNSLYVYINPYIGYYQNSPNYISINWGNTSAVTQNALITIEVPAGVTFSTSMLSGNTYSQTGNQVTLTATVSANTSYYDVLIFDVPGGINNGTLHTYSIRISPLDTLLSDCEDVIDSLCMVVGNSYDPNNKTVNLPEIISPDVQDEFLYTIRFQNTGTAPAQDVYIDDTLSSNLDWSTFVLVESSHSVEVLDLGNGIKRFHYEDIWLPDSTSNLSESQGHVSFRIKEKATNGEGSTIYNTAYIYFDHNPAIVTNTTYNINTTEVLGIKDQQINTVVIAPNPASSTLKIISGSFIDKIEIHDLNGKLCLEDLSKTGVSRIIPITHFDPGVYFITIWSESGESTLRFIKQ